LTGAVLSDMESGLTVGIGRFPDVRAIMSNNEGQGLPWIPVDRPVLPLGQIAANGSNLRINGGSPPSWSLRLLRRMRYSRTRPSTA
jgi:hypothetical protein